MIGKFVAGEGPENAYIMIVGEGPGKMESDIGKPFVGPAGQELNRYLLMQAGVRRQDCYVTNMVKWRTDEENSDPTPEDIDRDAGILQEEIKNVSPKLIVTVGRISTRHFLGEVDMEFAYGLPHWSDKWSTWIFPVYHPAAGLHQADKYSKLVYNSFKRLGAYLNGSLDRPEDNTYFYHESWNAIVPPWIPVAVDTEGYEKKPWGLSYSCDPGTGQVVRKGKDFTCKSDKVIFHNALWDLKVLRAMGVEIPYEKIEDTMLISHLLCLEPKKLKALAYREAGMEMENYQDVIKEADDRIAYNYLNSVLTTNNCKNCDGAGEVSRPWKRNPNKTTTEKCSTCTGDGTTLPPSRTQLVFNDDFTAKLYTPESSGRRIRSILGSEGNYRKQWEDLDSSNRQSIEARFGKIPEVSLDEVTPRDRAITYSARDADATLRVYHRLRPRLSEMGLEEAYKIDLGCIPIIDRMHQNGILIDKDYFTKLDQQFEQEQYATLQKLYDEIGLYFNPSSPPQMKAELAKFGITKDLESTKERDLKLLKIKAKDPKVGTVIDLALQYRELNKFRGNYTLKLRDQADENSRLHTTFILSAQEGEDSAEAPTTGRLSSRGPNLQNIPVASDKGNLIRAGFIAKPGCVLLSSDLSQIELRVGAHLAHEENMIEAFKSGKDLHALTASRMFKVPYEDCIAGPGKKKYRYPAKAISFGVFYGMSKYRLQSELAVEGLTISLDEAQGFIDAWFDAYPGIRNYMYQVQAEARQNYFVRTLFGHIRYLPNVHSKDKKAQAEALRQAGNHPVQGTAGEILKMAMANIHKRVYPMLNKMGYFEPLLTIHDEVIFEVDASIADLAADMVAKEMEHAVELDVPLLSTYKTAKNWSELKD